MILDGYTGKLELLATYSMYIDRFGDTFLSGNSSSSVLMRYSPEAEVHCEIIVCDLFCGCVLSVDLRLALYIILYTHMSGVRLAGYIQFNTNTYM